MFDLASEAQTGSIWLWWMIAALIGWSGFRLQRSFRGRRQRAREAEALRGAIRARIERLHHIDTTALERAHHNRVPGREDAFWAAVDAAADELAFFSESLNVLVFDLLRHVALTGSRPDHNCAEAWAAFRRYAGELSALINSACHDATFLIAYRERERLRPVEDRLSTALNTRISTAEGLWSTLSNPSRQSSYPPSAHSDRTC